MPKYIYENYELKIQAYRHIGDGNHGLTLKNSRKGTAWDNMTPESSPN